MNVFKEYPILILDVDIRIASWNLCKFDGEWWKAFTLFLSLSETKKEDVF